ncbi:MAG: hypothetical protein ACK55Z_17605, partial [bacterium]
MHRHPPLGVHADQHLRVSSRSRQLLHEAFRPRYPCHDVFSDVDRRQRRDMIHAESLHYPHCVVAIYHRNHVVAVDSGATAAQA